MNTINPSVAMATAVRWKGSPRAIAFEENGMREKLAATHLPCFVVQDFAGRIGITHEGELSSEGNGLMLIAYAPAATPAAFGDPTFRDDYQLKYCYKAGAMANGIASADLVINLGRAGFLGSFGAAGLVPNKVKAAIETIQAALPHQSYAFNLIHSPTEKALEERAVDLFLQNGVRIVEASAYLDLTIHIVHYRAAGLSLGANGEIISQNKVIAKVSRKEVAGRFMSPAPLKYLDPLLAAGKITAEQHALAQRIAVADDITVEADSGGHTDNRPLVALFPTIIHLRDKLQAEYQYAKPIRIGAAGGISTPESALAAFMMGAAYVVTGSVNQACVESGTSDYVRDLLAKVESTDVMMAPASDMFEMGVNLQVLKRGTLFGPRAKKLYELYKQYDSIEAIPSEERAKLEAQVFKQPLEAVWQQCIAFFEERDPEQIERAKDNPHRKMALVFRWYLGLSSNWANAGIPERSSDYQIWCGPAMGAFNDWVRGTSLALPQNRVAAVVAEKIMEGVAYLYRVQTLILQGAVLPVSVLQVVVE